MKLSYLGYGLLEVWSACIIFNQNSVAENVTKAFSDGGLGFGAHLLFANISTVAIALATLFFVLKSLRGDGVRSHRRATILSTGVNVCGTLLILSGGPFASLAGLLIAGLGNAWLWICWGDIYAALDTESVELVAVGSVVLQAAGMLLVFASPSVVQAALLLFMAPASCGLYMVAVNDVESQGLLAQEERERHSPMVFNGVFRARMVVGLGVPIAMAYFLWDCGFAMPALGDGIETVLVIGLLTCALLFLGFLRFSPGFGVSSICTVELALLVAACVFAISGLRESIGSALVLATVMVSQYFILVYCARLFRLGFGNVVFTFGVGQLINHTFGCIGGVLAGILLFFPTVGQLDFSPAKGCLICAIAFFVSALVRGGDGEAATDVEGASGRKTADADREERLLDLARGHHLSTRETEVFMLLANGRSAPFIRDELMVSLNTVSSHIKHIYGKMGIHSRQELFDLVNGEELGKNA